MDSITTLLPSLSFLALGGSIMLFWGQAKEMVVKLIRLVVVEAQIHHFASRAVLYYLREHGKRAPTNVVKYMSLWEYIKKSNGLKLVAFEGTRDLKNQWYWIDGNLVTISDKHGLDKETNVSFDMAVTIRYLRGTIDVENLICRAIKWYEERDSIDNVRRLPRFHVQRFVGKTATYDRDSNPGERLSSASPGVSASHDEDWKYSRLLNYTIGDIGYSKRDFFHVFNPNALKIKEDVTRWLNAKEWYEKKGLLHRRGSLLYGPPGSGKSSLIRKIGQSLDLPVLAFELGTMDDPQFIEYWNRARQSQPCLVVMEDIDTVFDGRKPATKNIRLSLECLLNCISGVEPAEGIYLFVTTNKLESLDEALGIPNDKGVSTRPGRLDTCFHMGDISETEKHEIVEHFLLEHPEVGVDLIEKSNGCTAAQFSDLCAQKALELYWQAR